MKNIILFIILLFCVIVNAQNGCTNVATFTSISNCAQLQSFISSDLTGCYKLTKRIDCTGSFTPLGSQAQMFTGTLDGQGNIITGINIPMAGTDFVGLFRFIGSIGVVRNVALVDPVVEGDQQVGALVGQNGGTISNVFVMATTPADSVKGTLCVGGIAGSNVGTINTSGVEESITVQGQSNIGGLAGFSGLEKLTQTVVTDALIDRCFSQANVMATAAVSRIGGFIGAVNGGKIINCYANGTVTATGNTAGGFIGILRTVTTANTVVSEIENCYATGPFTGLSDSGLFYGTNDAGTFKSCFYEGGASQGDLDDPEVSGVSDMITEPASTFTGSGWLGTVWSFGGGMTPQLIDTVNDFVANIYEDPHFRPLKVEYHTFTYQPSTKKSGQVYNIVTHPMVQWNAKWTIYNDLPIHANRSLDNREYITQAAFTIRHPEKSGTDVRVLIQPHKYPSGHYSGVLSVLLNNNNLKVGSRNYLFGTNHPQHYVHKLHARMVVISTPELTVKYHLDLISDRLDPSERVKVLKGAPCNWPLLNNVVKGREGLLFAHGLLGQTARPNNPYKPPYQNCFDCFVQGNMEDYKVSGLFENDFTYNLY